tara:strand:- start:28 stop:399 length:372 start_codon:yes stop_codon:yes gene_type:complete
MEHVNRYASASSDPEERTSMFLNFFCCIVASIWRFNSVMAAQPYKTKNEHAAVLLALKTASHRLNDYAITADEIRYEPMPTPPTDLDGVRGFGMGSVFARPTSFELSRDGYTRYGSGSLFSRT